MKTLVQNGETIEVVGGTELAGDAVEVGSNLVGIAKDDAVAGEPLICIVEGVFAIEKAVAGDVIAQGAIVNVSGGQQATVGARAGICWRASASGDLSVQTKLNSGHG